MFNLFQALADPSFLRFLSEENRLIIKPTRVRRVASRHREHLPLFHSLIFCDSATAMLAKIYSAAVYGVDAYEAEIEVNGAGGDRSAKPAI